MPPLADASASAAHSDALRGRNLQAVASDSWGRALGGNWASVVLHVFVCPSALGDRRTVVWAAQRGDGGQAKTVHVYVLGRCIWVTQVPSHDYLPEHAGNAVL